MIQYSVAPTIEPKGRSVLDTPLARGMTIAEATAVIIREGG